MILIICASCLQVQSRCECDDPSAREDGEICRVDMRADNDSVSDLVYAAAAQRNN